DSMPSVLLWSIVTTKASVRYIPLHQLRSREIRITTIHSSSESAGAIVSGFQLCLNDNFWFVATIKQSANFISFQPHSLLTEFEVGRINLISNAVPMCS